ncbi:MAG: ABC transporter substrate-binding protein [Rhodospirillales bacterium]
MRKILLTVLAAGSMGLALINPAETRADTIKIGGLLETSGFLASLGKPGLEGAMLAIDHINAAGGINGEKLELINVNTESDNTKAVSAARRLMETDGLVAMIGAMNSGSTYAIIDVLQRAKFPIIANGASRGLVLPPEDKPYIFLAPLTDVLVQSVMMKDMNKRGISKIAVLYADSGFGTSGHSQLMKHAADYGIEVVIEETYGNADKDMTPQLTKIRSSEAQATVIWGTGPGQAISTKNHRQLGIESPLYLSHAANDFNFVRLADGAAEGILIPSSKLYVLDSLSDSDPQKAVIARFVADYKAKFGNLPATFAGNGYDSVTIIANAIRKAGKDREAIRKAIEETKGYVGVTAVYSYSPTDHFGAQGDSVVMLSVKDGQFIVAE